MFSRHSEVLHHLHLPLNEKRQTVYECFTFSTKTKNVFEDHLPFSSETQRYKLTESTVKQKVEIFQILRWRYKAAAFFSHFRPVTKSSDENH